jgi:hypothetical protein
MPLPCRIGWPRRPARHQHPALRMAADAVQPAMQPGSRRTEQGQRLAGGTSCSSGAAARAWPRCLRVAEHAPHLAHLHHLALLEHSTRSQISRITAMSCVMSTMVRPAAVDVAQQRQDGLRRLGVERRGGLVAQQQLRSCTSARAMPTRCFWPPESLAGYTSALSPRPTSSSRRATACPPRRRDARPPAAAAPRCPHGLGRQQVEVLEDHAGAPAQLHQPVFVESADQSGRQCTMPPASGISSALMVRSKVDLPAPLRPMMPKISRARP